MRFLPTLFITSVLDSELWNSLVGVMGVLGQEMETVGTGDVVPPFPMKQGFFVHLLTARVGNPVAGHGPQFAWIQPALGTTHRHSSPSACPPSLHSVGLEHKVY